MALASPVLVHSLSQTYTVFALFPDRYRVCRFSRVFPAAAGHPIKLPTVVPAGEVLIHMCGIDTWSRAQTQGVIRPEASGSAGDVPFIHLSTPQQVHLPANRLYRGRQDLVLLHVDPALLDSPVRWEPGVPTDPESMLFPHLYGPLLVAAVIRVSAYLPAPDGSFLPVAGAGYPSGDST
jgi:uncharacterized protein (DUF952 family)